MDADLDYMFIFKWFRQNKQLNNPVPVGTGNVIRVLTRYFPLLSICSLFSFQCSFVCPQPHTHSSGISIASRSETGMAKCEGCLGYS